MRCPFLWNTHGQILTGHPPIITGPKKSGRSSREAVPQNASKVVAQKDPILRGVTEDTVPHGVLPFIAMAITPCAEPAVLTANSQTGCEGCRHPSSNGRMGARRAPAIAPKPDGIT